MTLKSAIKKCQFFIRINPNGYACATWVGEGIWYVHTSENPANILSGRVELYPADVPRGIQIQGMALVEVLAILAGETA